jgi:hypothetical protein
MEMEPRLRNLLDRGFEINDISHASAILAGDFPDEFDTLIAALDNLYLPVTEIIGSGGGKALFTQRLAGALEDQGWTSHSFKVEKIIDGLRKPYSTHEIDHVKSAKNGKIACEIEWNNKDPFFDRDLENFKRLHADLVISLGIIITRGTSLQDNMKNVVRQYAKDRSISDFASLKLAGIEPTSKQIAAIKRKLESPRNPVDFATAWSEVFVSNKYGTSTTHWSKLEARVARGVGNPCPLLLIGLPSTIVTIDTGPVAQLSDDDDGDSE